MQNITTQAQTRQQQLFLLSPKSNPESAVRSTACKLQGPRTLKGHVIGDGASPRSFINTQTYHSVRFARLPSAPLVAAKDVLPPSAAETTDAVAKKPSAGKTMLWLPASSAKGAAKGRPPGRPLTTKATTSESQALGLSRSYCRSHCTAPEILHVSWNFWQSAVAWSLQPHMCCLLRGGRPHRSTALACTSLAPAGPSIASSRAEARPL